MNQALDFTLCVPLVSCHCGGADSSAEPSALTLLPKQVWPEAFWLLLFLWIYDLWPLSTNSWSVLQITKRRGKNTLEFLQVICRSKNKIHKLLGFGTTRSIYGMVADYTWLWISGWGFNPVISERHFYTPLKIFKVSCNNIGVFKSEHKDVELLPTAFSWPE